MPTALITGPTSGIGRGFAVEFARRGFDVVLVARDETRLTELARELLSDYGVRSEVMPADLSIRADVDRVATRLADDAAPISALVNNAGFGLRSSFLGSTVEAEQRLHDVLVTAVLRLTHAAVPGMVTRGNGMIINVSSVAGWISGGTYSAAKAYVTVLSESLAQELSGTGVRVIAVCPGFVHTEFHERADVDMSGLPDWLWLDVSQVVGQAMRDLALDRPVSVAGLQYRVVARVLRHGPRLLPRLAMAVRSGSPRLGRRS
jgi:short-subunit dehydrogenase